MIRFCVGTMLSLASIFATAPANAEIFCATNALELSTALNDAAGNGEDDVVRVHTGTYDGGGAHDFDYAPVDFSGGGGDVGTGLIVIGGYTEFFNNPCGQILIEDPLLTVLDGGDVRRALRLHVYENSDVTVRLLSFINGTPGSDPFFFGGGLSYRMIGSDGGSVTVERNVFLSNQAHSGGALSIRARGLVRVVNNLFVVNDADACAAGSIRNTSPPSIFDDIYITNNTVIGNTTLNTNGGGGGLCLHAENSGLLVYNNNFWDNDLNDLYISNGGDNFDLRNNNFEVRDGDAPTNSGDNLSVEPMYEGGPFNFTPVRTSPLVDAGKHPLPPPALSFWYLTDRDLRSQTRVVGPAVDVGAYENERVFANGFETPGPFRTGITGTLCEKIDCDDG